MPTQLPRVPSLIPSSFATRAIGRDVSITIFTASSLNSGEKLFFGRGNYFTFPDVHPNGWTVRKPRGTPAPAAADVVAGGVLGGGEGPLGGGAPGVGVPVRLGGVVVFLRGLSVDLGGNGDRQLGAAGLGVCGRG